MRVSMNFKLSVKAEGCSLDHKAFGSELLRGKQNQTREPIGNLMNMHIISCRVYGRRGSIPIWNSEKSSQSFLQLLPSNQFLHYYRTDASKAILPFISSRAFHARLHNSKFQLAFVRND